MGYTGEVSLNILFLYFTRNYSLIFQICIRDFFFALKLSCSSIVFSPFHSQTGSVLKNIYDFFSWELKLMGKYLLFSISSHLNHIKVRFLKDSDI